MVERPDVSKLSRIEDGAASECPVIAQGQEREVRLWREHSTILAKTLKNAQHKLDQSDLFRHRNSPFEGEHSAWLRILRKHAKLQRPPPVAELRGYHFTNDRIVQLCAQVSDAHGRIGPSMLDIIKAGEFTKDTVAQLNYLASELIAWAIPVTDFLPGNIVQDSSGPEPRLVLVDGYRDVWSISLRQMSSWYNLRRMMPCFHKCARYMKNGCYWDEKTRQFLMPDTAV